MQIGDLAAEIGRGLTAGLAGTAVMTAVQMAEMKINDREASTLPAKGVEKVLNVEPRDEESEKVLAQLTHFDYGTSWGAVRGVLGALGIGGVAATGIHFALVWGTALVMLPSLDLSEPATKWSKKQLGQDFLHHAVYAVATGLAYEGLKRSSENGAA